MRPASAWRRRGLIAAGLALAGCRTADSLQLLAASRFADWEWQGPLPLTLPLREDRGWVLVQGQVNGHGPVDFVLDTGAPISVLLAGPGSPALDMTRQSRLGSADDPAAPTGAIQKDVELRLGPLRLRRHTLLAVPAASIGCRKEGQALPFQGVLGYELFNRFAAEIDRDAGVLRLHAPQQAARIARGPALPLDLVDRHPFVRAGLELAARRLRSGCTSTRARAAT
jgi:Aspartyl protease